MTSIPASRNARAMIFAPRSCPSSPGLATTTRIFLFVAVDISGRGRLIVHVRTRRARLERDDVRRALAHPVLPEPALADGSQQAPVGACRRRLAAAVEQQVQAGTGRAHRDVRP